MAKKPKKLTTAQLRRAFLHRGWTQLLADYGPQLVDALVADPRARLALVTAIIKAPADPALLRALAGDSTPAVSRMALAPLVQAGDPNPYPDLHYWRDRGADTAGWVVSKL